MIWTLENVQDYIEIATPSRFIHPSQKQNHFSHAISRILLALLIDGCWRNVFIQDVRWILLGLRTSQDKPADSQHLGQKSVTQFHVAKWICDQAALEGPLWGQALGAYMHAYNS